MHYEKRKVRVLVAPSCLTLCNPSWTVAHHASLSMEFSRQEYQSWLPFPSPGDFPNPGIKPRSLHCRQILYQLNYEGSSNSLRNQYSLVKK